MCHPAILTAVSVIGSLAGAATQASGIRQQAEANATAEERRAELAERQKNVNQTRAAFERRRTLERHQLDLSGSDCGGGLGSPLRMCRSIGTLHNRSRCDVLVVDFASILQLFAGVGKLHEPVRAQALAEENRLRCR